MLTSLSSSAFYDVRPSSSAAASVNPTSSVAESTSVFASSSASGSFPSASSSSSPVEALANASCADAYAAVEREVAKLNYCSSDADCSDHDAALHLKGLEVNGCVHRIPFNKRADFQPLQQAKVAYIAAGCQFHPELCPVAYFPAVLKCVESACVYVPLTCGNDVCDAGEYRGNCPHDCQSP